MKKKFSLFLLIIFYTINAYSEITYLEILKKSNRFKIESTIRQRTRGKR